MKNYLTGTRGGERQKKREGANTNTNTWPEAGKPWKGLRKKKRAQMETEQDERRRGGRKRLKPTYHSETYAYLGTRGTQPTWGGKNAWSRGPNGELVDENGQNNKMGFSSWQ